jgi:hypothetical protein
MLDGLFNQSPARTGAETPAIRSLKKRPARPNREMYFW